VEGLGCGCPPLRTVSFFESSVRQNLWSHLTRWGTRKGWDGNVAAGCRLGTNCILTASWLGFNYHQPRRFRTRSVQRLVNDMIAYLGIVPVFRGCGGGKDSQHPVPCALFALHVVAGSVNCFTRKLPRYLHVGRDLIVTHRIV
jgi:hypothetical protein